MKNILIPEIVLKEIMRLAWGSKNAQTNDIHIMNSVDQILWEREEHAEEYYGNRGTANAAEAAVIGCLVDNLVRDRGNFGRALEVSIEHITQDDAAELEEMAKDKYSLVSDYGYGLIIRTQYYENHDQDEFEERIEPYSNLSEDFKRILTFAWKSQCEYLVLDGDGPVLASKEFPLQDWD